MKVLYDHQIFSMQDYGGISLYFTELIKNLRTCNLPITPEIADFLSGNVNLQTVQQTLGYNLVRRQQNKVRNRATYLVNKLYSQLSLSLKKYDLFHPTYYNPYFLPMLGEKPFVITYYDMIHELYPDQTHDQQMVHNKTLLGQKATHIMTISENTKKDVCRIYHLPESSVTVTYLGGDNINDPANFDCQNFAAKLPQKYILYVGSRKAAYKNFPLFLQAVAPILKDSDYYLVCVGGGAFTENEKSLITKLAITEKVIMIPLTSDTPMQGVFYKNASLFVYPSLYEGFGIPIIEAFFMRCPVALSNASCFPEIAEESAFYFDPTSVDSMTAVFEKALNDQLARERNIVSGYLRAKDFTWNKTAEVTAKVYQNVL